LLKKLRWRSEGGCWKLSQQYEQICHLQSRRLAIFGGFLLSQSYVGLADDFAGFCEGRIKGNDVRRPHSPDVCQFSKGLALPSARCGKTGRGGNGSQRQA
jgi:hypothetical protein